MFKALFSTVTGWFSSWMIYVILGLLATNAFTYALYQQASKQNVSYAIAGELAKEEKERVETQHNKTLKDVTNAWEKYSKDSKRKAIAAYDAKYRDLARVCYSGPLSVSGDARSTEILYGPESERRTCTTEFIGTCVNDAAFRIGVRQWVIGNQLKVAE